MGSGANCRSASRVPHFSHDSGTQTVSARAHKPAFGLESLPGSAELGAPEFVYRQLLDAVLSQRLRPGARLQEQALAGIFDVGRATVRAVLQRLAHDGVVDLRANRGARIDRPDAAEVADLFEARRVIECETAARAAARAKRGEIGAPDMRPLGALAREEAAHAKAGRRGAALRLACDFHLGLARLGGNVSLVVALERTVVRVALAVGAFERPAHDFVGATSRLILVDAVLDGDARAARRAMRAHLDALEASLDPEGGEASGDLDAAFAHLGQARDG